MLSVGPVGPVVITIRTITIIGWLTAIYAAIPFGPPVPEDVGRLAIGVAVVGTMKYLVRRSQRPASEFYRAGKEMGRLELLAEQRAGDGVVSLEDRRQLRAASEGARAVGGGRWLADQ